MQVSYPKSWENADRIFVVKDCHDCGRCEMSNWLLQTTAYPKMQ